MDKTVVVRLRAEIGRYQADLSSAATSTRNLGKELSGAGKAGRADLDSIARGSTVVGTALVAGFGLAASATMGFDKQLSELGAVSSATAEEMNQLRDAALEAGAKTAYSAAEAATAQTELAKAGVSTADILGGALTGSLDLAAAGGLELGQAAEIAATAMTTFGLAGKDVSHIADVLAAGANKSAADVDEMAQALAQSGLVADQFGLSLEDSVGVLSMFAQNGLRGSDAGTSFKTMLQRLVPTSKEAAEKMADLGIDMFDAQGKFVGVEGAAQELKDGLAGLTEEQRNSALATIFGSDAVRAATVLYQNGAAGVAEWVAKVDDAGFAGEVAGKRMDNLAGDLEELRGSIETALIEGGSHGTSALRFMAQGATQAVNGFAGLPGPLQATGLGLGAVAGAGTLALGAFTYLAPRIREAQDALIKMEGAGAAVGRNFGNIAKGAALVGAGIAVFSAWEGMMASAKAEAEDLSSTWRDLAFSSENTQSFDAFAAAHGRVTDEMVRMNREADSSSAPWDADYRTTLRAGAGELENIGTEMGTVTDAATHLANAFGISKDAALEFVLAQQAEGLDVMGMSFDSLTGKLGENYLATTTGTQGSHEMQAAMGTLGSEIASVEDEVQAFNDALDNLYNAYFSVQDAQDSWQRTLNDLPDVLKAAREEGLSLNDVLSGQSNAAIDVRDHMEDMVQKGLDLITTWQEQGATGDDLTGRIGYLSAAWRKQAEDAGLPAPVVDHYLGLLSLIPTSKNTAVHANVTGTGGLDSLIAKLGSIQGNYVANVGLNYLYGVPGGSALPAAGGLIGQASMYRAAGGSGPHGTDTVPAWLTPGEYVMRAGAVDHWGAGTFAAMNAGMLPRGLGTMPAGGGATTTIVNNYVIHAQALSGYQVGRMVRDEILKFERRNG